MSGLDEAARKVFILERELDITNADHIALYLEANKPLDSNVSWLACRIIEAHEVRTMPLLEALRELEDALLDGLCNEGLPDFDPSRLERARDQARAAIRKATQSKDTPQ